jgi:hypothetical protein
MVNRFSDAESNLNAVRIGITIPDLGVVETLRRHGKYRLCDGLCRGCSGLYKLENLMPINYDSRES